jgi:hypothetical protein
MQVPDDAVVTERTNPEILSVLDLFGRKSFPTEPRTPVEVAGLLEALPAVGGDGCGRHENSLLVSTCLAPSSSRRAACGERGHLLRPQADAIVDVKGLLRLLGDWGACPSGWS